MTYRRGKGCPLRREEIDRLNLLLSGVQSSNSKSPSYLIPASSAASAQQRRRSLRRRLTESKARNSRRYSLRSHTGP
jgi:hypothetical protein